MNAPETVVYNQCSNIVLRYLIKSKEGHTMETPKDIPGRNPLPPPFKPEDIDCIIGGFPWCVSPSFYSTFISFEQATMVVNLTPRSTCGSEQTIPRATPFSTP
jgi:hypothetical protein